MYVNKYDRNNSKNKNKMNEVNKNFMIINMIEIIAKIKIKWMRLIKTLC